MRPSRITTPSPSGGPRNRCTAAWLAEDLRAAADASTPGWAALKRFLGPPDGEVVLRDGRIVKRATVVDV